MDAKKQMLLRQHPGEDGAAYLELRDHPHVNSPGIAKRSIAIRGLIEGYFGPRLVLDFNGDGVPIGIEIVYPWKEDE